MENTVLLENPQEHKLEVDEELSIFMNQMNLEQIIVKDQIQKCCTEPVVRFINDRFAIVDNDKVFMTADWHFIGEFHTEKENPNIKGYEFVWSWALKPDGDEDPHVKEVSRVTELLPHGLNSLTFPLVQFEDAGIIEIIKAYAFQELKLEFMHVIFNEKLRSYGIFGLYNIEYNGSKRNNVLDTIVNQAKKKANELRKVNSELTGTDAIKQAWETPEILSLISAYQHEKRDKEKTAEEFKNFFKRAIADPSLVIDNPAPEEKYTNAISMIERSLDKVREEELSNLEQVGDESE